MGLKYFTRYRTVDGSICEIRFYTEGFDGTPVEWLSTEGAVDFEYGGFDGMFSNPIQPSQARMSFILKEFYDLSDFVFNRKTYFCEIVNLDVDKVKWSGWVEPWGAEREHSKPPHRVSLMASCGLAHLLKKKYANPNNVFKKTGLQIIQECLQIIGSTLPIRISTHMVETSWGGDDRLGLNSFEIHTSRYFDSNGEAMYCDVIVNDILNHFNAEIVQWENRWVIRAVVDNATSFYDSYIDIGSPDGPLYFPSTYPVNVAGGALTLNGGTHSILAPKNKYRVEVDFGTQMPFFENGNMLMWTEDGLVGWDFSHMTKSTTDGWEKFVISGASEKAVLKINGKSPPPYSRIKPKKKKNRWLKNLLILPLVVDAIGIVNKNSLEDIEPTQYIESPGGKISKGDKSVTISFDYETEAFSPAILISIRIPVTQAGGKVVNLWADPSSNVALAGADKSAAGLTNEFTFIRVDPVDMGKLTDKGTINVSGNPNYPSANFSPGSKNTDWTWTVTGVPDGEYRRIGGINGVLVENGDLVIARVPNNGGTQAQVGGNWEIIGIRNNVKKATFSLTVALNTAIITTAGEAFPADKVYIRFYKMSNDKGFSGDWYKVYNVGGALEGFIAKEESGRYATTLERGDVTDEEAETIQLISGDYTPWYSGSWTKPGSIENTRTWRRRPDLNEAMSIYRAMMLDRLSLTSRPLAVINGTIKLPKGAESLTFLHTILMHDLGDMRMRLTRFSFNDYSRKIAFRAVEVKYEEIPREELKQDSYIPGSRQLNTVPGEGDGIYPSKQDSTSGRLNAEDLPLTDDEIEELIAANGRLGALFENIPPLIFTAGELSTQGVDLSKYLSEIVLYNNDGQEIENQMDFTTLEWLTVKKPLWVTDQSIVFLTASVTGKPLYVGLDSITFKVAEPETELTEEEKQEQAELEAWAEEAGVTIPPVEKFFVEVTIPIQILPKTVIGYEYLNAVGENPALVGKLPGVYQVQPKSDFRFTINGTHDKWQASIFGGGDTGDNPPYTVSNSVPLTGIGTYRMFDETGGIVLPAGNYRFFVTTWIGENIVSRNDILFTLYDEGFLNLLKFFFTKEGSQLSQISYDGTTALINPGAANIQTVIEDTEHDKAVIVLDKMPDESELFRQTRTVVGSATDATYYLYDADQEFTPGAYRATVYLYLDDQEVLVRYVHFKVNKKAVLPVGGSLKLVKKASAGTTTYNEVSVLPETGGLYDLPQPAFNVLSDSITPEYDWECHTYEQKRGDKLILVNSGSVSYSYPVTQSEYYIFGEAGSVGVKGVHVSPSSQRVIHTRKLGGESGDTVAVFKSDFSFGVLEDLDDVETGETGGGLTDYVARDGMAEEIIDYVKHFDVLYDGETIGLNADNELEVLDEGITFEKIQDLPSMKVIGNLSGTTGTPYAVDVKEVLEEAELGDLVTAIAIKNYITQELEGSISGTLNYIPKYTSPHELGLSQIFDNGTNVGVGQLSPISKLHVGGDIRSDAKFIGGGIRFGSSSADKISLYGDRFDLIDNIGFGVENNNALSYKAPQAHNFYINTLSNGGGGALMRLTGASLTLGRQLNSTITGVPPFVVASNLLNVNLHADLLNKSVIAGTGLTGGGILTANRTLSFDTTWGDDRYLTVSGSGVVPYVSLNPTFGAASDNVSGLDLNSVAKTSSFFATDPLNGPIAGSYGMFLSSIGVGTASAFQMGHVWGVQDAFYYRRKAGGVTYAWEQVASRSHVAATYVPLIRTVTAGAGLINGGGLSSNITLDMGTPSTLSNATTNAATADSHTHAITTGSLVQGANIVLSGSLANRLVGSGDVTIAATAIPWSIVTSRPTTLDGFGITDGVKTIDFTTGLSGKENTFTKGNLVQSSGILLQGTLTNRLVGSGDVTVSLQWSGVTAGSYRRVDVDIFGRVTGGSNPTTLSEYGLDTTVYTKTEINGFLSGKANSSHTHTASQITDFSSAVRGQLSGAGGISYNSSTGVISFSGGAAYVTSSGVSTNSLAKWTSNEFPGDLIDSNISDDNVKIQVTRPLMLMGYTQSQRRALSAPNGSLVYQTDAGAGGVGIYAKVAGGWLRLGFDYLDLG